MHWFKYYLDIFTFLWNWDPLWKLPSYIEAIPPKPLKLMIIYKFIYIWPTSFTIGAPHRTKESFALETLDSLFSSDLVRG